MAIALSLSCRAATPTDLPPVAPVEAPKRAAAVRIDAGLPESAWPSTTSDLDAAAIEGLLVEAEISGTDALLVLVDGKTVIERYFDRPRAPIETMSVTKSVVSLAIAMLLDEGKIASLDVPLSTWFPSWKKGRKAEVTLRHLLTHTSGIAHRQGANVINREADRVAFVLESEVSTLPGTVFSYNNEAVQLLAAIVLAASGEPLDAYMNRRLFEPLGIREWSWEKDRAGNVMAYYGLSLHARDLAKIGVLMLDGGRWEGKQIVPASFVAAATVEQFANSSHGFLWWLRRSAPTFALRDADVETLAKHGVAPTSALQSLVGQRFPGTVALWLAVADRCDASGRIALARLAAAGARPFEEQAGRTIGYAADGWLGQQLIVLPEHRLIAVRQHRAPTDREADQTYNETHGFFGLLRWLDLAIASN
ncbi:MAG TPA: serine hydrolase [Nannocystaceae bacterium]|nr:serine hydrolase [Nannocystaceae bacterium]